MSAPPPSPAGYPPPPAHAKQPLEEPPPAQQSTAASPPPPPNNLPPGVIALIIIVPVLAALLTVLYWRRKVHRRTHLYASRISQPDPHNPNAPHRPGAPRFIIPPGGTGADRPEGQRRADRMWRLMNGINRRPSRSDSVRTLRRPPGHRDDPCPSPAGHRPPAVPPPNYESSTRTPAQSSSTLPAGPSSAQLPPLQPLPALGASFDTQTEPSRAALIPPPPPPPQLPRLTLPSHGPTPQQLSFLGSVATLASLGLPRPPDPHPDTSAPPPAFEAHPSANTLPR
ncbi:hypothetical protein PtA15_8A680 [Puccinia triticina]|uniref:Uncharacterized protein n=1 Tax=Puccinia triticina TaxID=208348 RepID=A0ABY7CSY8_9BASI|nr:uncharacterized protein PtA15_8A680 [Puccinia triticina]WAQ87774.1 hypothetical protein PtA15_8A680 [Puccinia triticina]